jgi:hypothetical protein
MTTVLCPYCGQSALLADPWSAPGFTCPHCQRGVTFSQPVASRESQSFAVVPADPRRKRDRSKTANQSTGVLLIVAILIAALVGVVALSWTILHTIKDETPEERHDRERVKQIIDRYVDSHSEAIRTEAELATMSSLDPQPELRKSRQKHLQEMKERMDVSDQEYQKIVAKYPSWGMSKDLKSRLP